MRADVKEEDAVKNRQGEHVDEEEDVMEENSLIVIVGPNPAPTSTSLIV